MPTEENDAIKFHVANRAATHLGRKLYSTTPPALAELIANSYDAYATKAYVTIGANLPYIVVADDGVGMGLDALNSKYALIGREKIPEPVPKGFTKREPMGKKGIGKLASFSLGDEYEVYTKTDKDDLWTHFKVCYSNFLTDDAEYRVETEKCNLPDDLQAYREFEHGFITVIHKLRRMVNASTTGYLKTQLSRRFYIKSSSENFSLFLNEEPIDLSLNAYYGDMDYATYVGFSKEEIRDLLDADSNNVDLKAYDVTSLKDVAARSNIDRLVNEKGLRGWIGTVEQPKQLKADGNNSANIVVYINGKIADEDVLRNYPSAMMASQYVVGEFFADYLGLETEDPITSSRQGLDNADTEVRELIDAIKTMRSTVLNSWNERRERDAVKRLPEWATRDEGYQKWLEGLTKSQKSLNNRLLKTLTVQMDEGKQDEEQTRALLNSFIDVVENDGIFDLAAGLREDADREEDETLVILAKMLSGIAASESIKQANIVQERLQAIETLQGLMDNPSTLERAFKEHLAKNPWLINPYWNQTPKTESEVKVVTEEFNRLYEGKDEEYRRTYIDICMYVAEEKYPIIVELKRNTAKGYAKFDVTSIYQQITSYRFAIRQKLSLDEENIGEEQIKAYFIGSEDAGAPGHGHTIEITDNQMNILKTAKISLLTYRDLVNHARQAYRDHIEVIENDHNIPYFGLKGGAMENSEMSGDLHHR